MCSANRMQASVADSPVRSISHPPRQPVDIKMEWVYITDTLQWFDAVGWPSGNSHSPVMFIIALLGSLGQCKKHQFISCTEDIRDVETLFVYSGVTPEKLAERKLKVLMLVAVVGDQKNPFFKKSPTQSVFGVFIGFWALLGFRIFFTETSSWEACWLI